MKESSLKGKLRRLGSSANKVAAQLKKRGIQGRPGDCDACPVANFLATTVKGFHYCSVSGSEIELTTYDSEGNESYVNVTPPKAVMSFIEGFDDGRFPKLVEPGFERY